VPTSGWSTLVEYADRLSAEAAMTLLKCGAVPSHIIENAPLPGSGEFSVQVPAELLHRARWLLQATDVTDRELDYLATNDLSGNAGESP
jgi:hypothetical protein